MVAYTGRLEHAGGAAASTLTSTLGATEADLTIAAADLSNYPDGTVGPFWIVIDKEATNAEKILCASRSGNVLQVWTDGLGGIGRGGDGTVIQEHSINAPIEHVWVAEEADATNKHQQETDGAHGFPDVATLVTLTGAQTLEDKTLEAPYITQGVLVGGTVDNVNATFDKAKIVVPVTDPNQFEIRNIFLSSGTPTAQDGQDGDVWMQFQ